MMEKYGVRICPKCGSNNVITEVAPPHPSDYEHVKIGEVTHTVAKLICRFQDVCECGHVSKQNEPEKPKG